MGLLNLPLEIHREIIEFCVPEGIEQLSETCKTLYNAAQPFLSDHSRKRREYTVVEYDDEEDEDSGEENNEDEEDDMDKSENSKSNIFNCVDLLLKIAQEPVIARYIRIADLRNDFEPYMDDAEQQAIAYDKLITHKNDILKLLEPCRPLPQAGVDATTFWEFMINEEAQTFSPPLITLAILSLLTEVRKLALPKHFQSADTTNDGRFKKVLDSIIKAAQSTAAQTGRQVTALAKLETLLLMAGIEYDDRVPLQIMVPFLSIPSVHTMLGGGCVALDDGYTGYPFDPDYEGFGQNLERIELAGCTVGPHEVRKMLQRCPKIKDFRLNYTVKWHGCGWNWNAGHFVRAIEDMANETLEEIGIDIAGYLNQIGTGVVSMKRFQKLKQIELNVEVFFGVPCGGEIDRAWAYDSDEAPLGDPEFPKVTELLPASAEKLLLLAVDSDEHAKCLEALFVGVTAAERDKDLPNLKSVEIQVGPNWAGDRLADSTGFQSPRERTRARWNGVVEALDVLGGRLRHRKRPCTINLTSEIFDYL